MKILIVDDDDDIRQIARLSLVRLGGMEVVEAATGADALRKADEERPDAILLDMMMPVMDGPTTLAALKNNPGTARIPVIFLTARAMKSELDHLKALGAVGVLTKPFDPASLASQVRSVLNAVTHQGTDRDALLEQLRFDYVRDAPAGLDRVVAIIDRLQSNPADPQALSELSRAFHNLAGSGATYGLPEVSRLAGQAEEECAAIVRGSTVPSAAQVVGWQATVETLRAQIAAAETGPRDRPITGPGLPQTKTPIDILVADDDEGICRFLEAICTREQMSVRTAGTCADARRGLVAGLPDGMLVDITLPDGSGYELVDHVRGLPGGDKVAVVMVSRLTGLLDKVEAIRCGADAYFEKPIDDVALVSKLKHLLRRDSITPPRVLTVESNPAESSDLRAILLSAGYEVLTCSDPHRFEKHLVTLQPDLVLIDVLLPELTGYELARIVRQNDAYATLPILFLATERQPQARLESVAAGADDCLLKSDPPALILATVAARLERGRLIKSLLERDGLTRLLTHTALIGRAEAVIAQSRRNPGRSVAFAMLDLDQFKSVNDRYGHAVGDRVLTTLAALLRRRLRQSDIIGRYGGEEFSVVLQDIASPEGVRLLSRILDEFAAIPHHAPGGTTFQTTFSAGVATLDLGHMDVRQWIAAADAALYAAKAAGRNRVLAGRS